MARAIFFAAIIALVAIYSREAVAGTTVNPSVVDPEIQKHTCSGHHEELSQDCETCEVKCCHPEDTPCDTSDSTCERNACVCPTSCRCRSGYARNAQRVCVQIEDCDCPETAV